MQGRKGNFIRRTIMRPGKPFSILMLFVAGCLSPITKRLDTTNEQLAITNQHLAAINEKMRETNALAVEMNQHLVRTNEQLSETNRRLATIEKGLPRLPRFGVGECSALPLEKVPEAAQ